MRRKNHELELYKLIMHPDEEDEEDEEISYVCDLGWINDKSFCIWVAYPLVEEFIEGLKNIFGYDMFDDGGFDANVQSDGLCIDLCEALGCYVNIEDLFPKEKYRH